MDPATPDPASMDPAAKEGKRFSKTTTSYSWAGISEGIVPPPLGHRGHSSVGGRKVRFWRWSAMETHSPVNASRRIQRALVDHLAGLGAAEIGLGVIEVDELAAVGQGRGGASDPRRGFGVLGHEPVTFLSFSSASRARG
jgi:hypothetical protein